ncbi:MAG: hypothetical protein OEL88_06420 [Sterolibacteriaceae bacterium MAG5]|nr:hypothetical protein [Candidatus Nitricoxidireducens bremensis]
MDHLLQITLLLAVAVAIMIAFQRLHIPTSLAHQAVKVYWLEAGAPGNIPVTVMDARLRAASALRRALEQATKAVQRLAETP